MSKGLKCPICKIGTVTVIESTIMTDNPLNRCDYCRATFQFIIEDDGEFETELIG